MANSKNIVFLGSKSEADLYNDAVLRNGRHSEDEAIIAMNPAVYAYLKRKGFSPESTLSYFTNESHVKLLEASKVMLDWLRAKADFVDADIGIQYAYRNMFVYCTRFALLGYLWMIEIVLNAVGKYDPETVSASFSGGKITSALYIDPEEKYLGYIVRTIAQERGLKFNDIAKSTSVKTDESNENLRLKDTTDFLIKLEGFKLWERKIYLASILSRRKRAFFTTPFYSLDKLALKLHGKHPEIPFHLFQGPVVPPVGFGGSLLRLIYFPSQIKYIDEQRRCFNDLIEQIKQNRELFAYRGISFSGALAKKIKDRFADFLLGLMMWAFKIKQFIERIRPSAFISNGNRVDDVILAEICGQKGIPVILISHGSHVRPKCNSENVEWEEHGRMLMSAPFSHLALQTPLAEDYLEVFPSSSSVIKTGPLIWGMLVNRDKSCALFKKMFNSKYIYEDVKVILHAGTPKPTNSLRLFVYETPDEYIAAIRELANAVEKIPNTILIIKFRPSKEIGMEDIKELIPLSDRVVLSVDEPFLDVLGIADLLVSFSSTTIEEALQNRIPVLLYGGGGRYQHIPASEIRLGHPVGREALYHTGDARHLEYAIKKIFELELDGRGKDRALFSRYIYREDTRQRIDDFLRI